MRANKSGIDAALIGNGAVFRGSVPALIGNCAVFRSIDPTVHGNDAIPTRIDARTAACRPCR